MRLSARLVLLCSAGFIASIALIAGCAIKGRHHAAQPLTLVEIVNKQALSPKRLADALYAKGYIEYRNREKDLRQAARLDPGDPAYPYLLAGTDSFTAMIASAAAALARKPDMAQKWTDTQEERVVKADRDLLKRFPNYLPALYEDALSRPTHRQQMAALAHIASLDNHNAKPYYLMAYLEEHYFVRGRKPKAMPRGEIDYPMTDAEWAEVMACVEKGNSRAAFCATEPRLPSVRDVRVTTGGHIWPAKAVAAAITAAMDADTTFRDTDLQLAHIPGEIAGDADARQLGVQAKWKALEMYRRGQGVKALQMLQVVRVFAYRFADSRPRRIISFLVAYVPVMQCEDAEWQILDSEPSALLRVKAEHMRWRRAIRWTNSVLKHIEVTVKGLRTDDGHDFTYEDPALENAAVKGLLAEIGPPGQVRGER